MSDKDGDKELDRDEFSAFVHPEVKLEKKKKFYTKSLHKWTLERIKHLPVCRNQNGQ